MKLRLPDFIVGGALVFSLICVVVVLVGFTHAHRYETMIQEMNKQKLPRPVLDSLRYEYDEFESIIKEIDLD